MRSHSNKWNELYQEGRHCIGNAIMESDGVVTERWQSISIDEKLLSEKFVRCLSSGHCLYQNDFEPRNGIYNLCLCYT